MSIVTRNSKRHIDKRSRGKSNRGKELLRLLGLVPTSFSLSQFRLTGEQEMSGKDGEWGRGVLQGAEQQEGKGSSILSPSLLPTRINLETQRTTQKGKKPTRWAGQHGRSSRGPRGKSDFENSSTRVTHNVSRARNILEHQGKTNPINQTQKSNKL